MASPTSDVADPPDLQVVADACLITSHRLTEWVSKAPTMEEDVALGNIGLDLLGQARGLFSHLGNEDQLAYFRDAPDWRHPVICELPNGDFGHTMLRQLFLDVWLRRVWALLTSSPADAVRGVAEKAIKENAYHLRHSTSWVLRLGDGTEESNSRMLAALDALWPCCGEIADGEWYDGVSGVLGDATLPVPPFPRVDDAAPQPSGASPSTRETLTGLLAEMQALARAHPGVTW
jgi:ring-1,2-phenylacetyl-CoA epoxidase subunit PaaC